MSRPRTLEEGLIQGLRHCLRKPLKVRWSVPGTNFPGFGLLRHPDELMHVSDGTEPYPIRVLNRVLDRINREELDREIASWDLDRVLMRTGRKSQNSGAREEAARRHNRPPLVEDRGKCVLHGCTLKAASYVELFSINATVPVCNLHKHLLKELDADAVESILHPDAMDYTSPAGRIVPYSEIYPEYDPEEGHDIPPEQAAMAAYNDWFLEAYERPEELVSVVEIDKSEWKKDPRFKPYLPYIVGEEKLVYSDPYADPDMFWILDDEIARAPFERDEFVHWAEKRAAKAKKEDVA